MVYPIYHRRLGAAGVRCRDERTIASLAFKSLARLTVLFTLNAFFFAGLFAVSPRPLPTKEGVSGMPWSPLAGLTGAVAVFAGLALIDKIGAGPVNGLIITANLLASLAIDHFGLMNMPVHHRRFSYGGRNCPCLSVLMPNQDGS
jgi:hypothetical protein